MADEPCQARPHDEVLAELMDWNLAKNEREWAAVHEIEKLRLAAQWLPMESAPNDGTRILCLDIASGEIRVAVRKAFCDKHFEMYGTYWYEWFRDEKTIPGHTWSMEPTHWMPLPKPPEETPHD